MRDVMMIRGRSRSWKMPCSNSYGSCNGTNHRRLVIVPLRVIFSFSFIFRVLPRRIQINDDREQATVAESDQLLARDRLRC